MTPMTNSRKQRLSLSLSNARPAYFKAPTLSGKPELKSDDLFSGTREIHILHNDDTYRLSITKQGKLILTK